MRYKVKGHEIRSENAAKSSSQASNHLVSWLENHEHVRDALDYGCGKLRYAHSLVKICDRLTVVDSAIQIDRVQKVNGYNTSVRDYVKDHMPQARVLTIDEFQKDNRKYQFALCANVISAIPNTRVRSSMLRRLVDVLTPKGECLFVTQYTNSFFTTAQKTGRAKAYLDGFLLESSHGWSYYGLLNRDALSDLVKRHDFNLLNVWREGQSAYVLAGNGKIKT